MIWQWFEKAQKRTSAGFFWMKMIITWFDDDNSCSFTLLQYTLVHLHCYNYEGDDNDGYTHNDNGDEQVEFWGVAELCGKFNESCRVKSLDIYIFYCDIYIEVDILMELLMVIYILRWIYWWYYEFKKFIQFQNENVFNILQIYTYAMCMHVKFTCYHL